MKNKRMVKPNPTPTIKAQSDEAMDALEKLGTALQEADFQRLRIVSALLNINVLDTMKKEKPQ